MGRDESVKKDVKEGVKEGVSEASSTSKASDSKLPYAVSEDSLIGKLRNTVGGDTGALAKQAGGFIDMKALYDAILNKTGGLTPQQYANEKY